MSKTEELNAAVQELTSNLKELLMAFNGYKAFIAGLSKNINKSLSVILNKTQSMVEMAYGNNTLEFYDPGKISNELLEEINKLILLKEELWKLSCFKVGDDRPFPPLPRVSMEGDHL